MFQLHAWGCDDSLSIIEPECIASAWFLASEKADFEIVLSNNTNLSPAHKLPVLITENYEKYCGFRDIVSFILKRDNRALDLNEEALISFINSNFNAINQYNLYIVTKNYEQYTRKLFQHYFPFPMMYNQPLKFYYSAQNLVRTIGLDSKSPGLFSFNGQNKVTDVETETVNENSEFKDDDTPVLSSLHEKQLLAKSKSRQILQESTFKIKCLNMVLRCNDKYEKISQAIAQNGDNHQELIAKYLYTAYIFALTFSELPDDFIAATLTSSSPHLIQNYSGTIKQFNQLLESVKFRNPNSMETPSLWNEVTYITNRLFANHSNGEV